MRKRTENTAETRRTQRIEGEGNKTAAHRFNEEQQKFVRSGRVEEKAREAERAREGGEKKELEQAEVIGRRHIADEDPEVTRPYRRGKRPQS